MKSELPYVGLGSPALKALLRPLLVEHRFVDRAQWEAAVLELWEDAEHREEWYAAIALLRHRAYRAWLDPDLLPLLEQLVRTGAWWDVVDEIAAHPVGQVLLDHRADATPVIERWSVDPTACGSGVRRCWRSCVTASRPTPTCWSGCWSPTSTTRRYGREFFVRKALGWALRQHARTDAAWVLTFVRTHADRLSGLSRREALKHQTGTSSTAPTA